MPPPTTKRRVETSGFPTSCSWSRRRSASLAPAVPSRHLRHPRAGRGPAFLGFASTGRAAPAPPRWCGTNEATTGPPAGRGRVVPAARRLCDPSRRLRPVHAACARNRARTSLRSTAGGSPRNRRRTLRVGGPALPRVRIAFPAGSTSRSSACRCPPRHTPIQENGGYSNLVKGLGASFLDKYKKYGVFSTARSTEGTRGVCGVSSFGPTETGSSYAFTLSASGRGCRPLRVARRQRLHGRDGGRTEQGPDNLGKDSTRLRRMVCASRHVCDSVADLISASPK